MHKYVSRWVRDLQRVTTLDRDPASGPTAAEISFWVSLERVLSQAKKQRDGPEVQLTLEILKQTKRFHGFVA